MRLLHVLNRKGQLDLTFHWAYILIAGVVILLFFFAVVLQQKKSAEEELSAVTIEKLYRIFQGAALSDQTVHVLDIPQLSLSFECDENGDSFYRIGRGVFTRQLPLQPLFAPRGLETSQLVLWTLDFAFPFHVTSFLFLNAPSITTLIIYSDTSTQLKERIERDVPSQFGFVYVPLSQFTPGFHAPARSLRLVFLTDVPASLPIEIQQLPDGAVSIMKLAPAAATFYQKNGNRVSYGEAVPIIDSFSEKNPAFYGVIFSDDSVYYRCTMAKAFQRLASVGTVYQSRTERVINQFSPTDVCALQVDPETFRLLTAAAQPCGTHYIDSCISSFSFAQKIKEYNVQLQRSNCPALY